MTVFGLGDLAFLGALVPPRPWTPADITTALWLDAADSSTITTVSGAVSQWNDKSGNGRNATQTTAALRPSYSATSALNSRPGLTFNSGSSQFLRLPNSAMPEAENSAFVVLRTASALAVSVFLGRTFINEGWSLTTFSNGDLRLRVFGVNAIASGLSTNSNYICTGVYDKANVQVSLNGGTLVLSAQTSDITYGAGDGASIGAASDSSGVNATAPFSGTISEILMLHSAVSIANRERFEGYLAHKWGLAANLPINHPYKSAAPTV